MLLNQTVAKVMWINADLGEGFSCDEELFKLIDWANIACDGHAGNADSIRVACELALEHNVQVGAHPSYPDRAGFGRKKPDMKPEQLLGELKRQVDLFENIAAQTGCTTTHFKPHGQLYNDAAFQEAESSLLIELARNYPHLQLLALAQSPQVSKSRAAGLVVVEEASPDRGYMPNGALAPRGLAGAMLDNPEAVKAQAVTLIRCGPLVCVDGSSRVVRAQTLCVHGDTPHALENARLVREALIDQDQDTFSGAD